MHWHKTYILISSGISQPVTSLLALKLTNWSNVRLCHIQIHCECHLNHCNFIRQTLLIWILNIYWGYLKEKGFYVLFPWFFIHLAFLMKILPGYGYQTVKLHFWNLKLYSYVPLENFSLIWSYVTISGEGFDIVIYTRHSWPVRSDGSLACQAYFNK